MVLPNRFICRFAKTRIRVKVHVARSRVSYCHRKRLHMCFLRFPIYRFMLIATPHTIKDLIEKGEVLFSGRPPHFLDLYPLSLDSFLSTEITR